MFDVRIISVTLWVSVKVDSYFFSWLNRKTKKVLYRSESTSREGKLIELYTSKASGECVMDTAHRRREASENS